ncbi:sorting nexin [Actinomortierella ambigua]|nr:sorting nexin [Actinomortierella ambigua]
MSSLDDSPTPSDVMTASFSGSTFDEEVNDPWNTNTARGISSPDLGSILSGIPLPPIYTTAFDLAGPQGGRITVLALNKIIGVSGLPPATVDKILNIVVAPTRSRVTKGECSVALALVAMAQKNMGLTIENLITHKEDLPIPFLPGLDAIDFGATEVGGYGVSALGRANTVVSDPWRSSTYKPGAGGGYPPPPSFLASPPIHSPTEAPRSLDPETVRKETYLWFTGVDQINLSFAPEKEGIFLFKHTNYIVESKNRQTSVIRRYSDFWWLLEVLTKRFPYRILPNLPPKRIGAAADEAFLEQRIRGLTRFMNALMRHPVLRNDPLVVSFLTEPVELAQWRKNVVISTEDEFTTRLPVPEELQRQIPANLERELEAIKRRLPGSIEYYRNMVNLMDRIQKRTEANSSDYMRFNLALNALSDCEKQCHAQDCYNCAQLSQGYTKIARHMGTNSAILDDEARTLQLHMVEELKRHRDLLVSVKELFQRRDLSREGALTEMLKKRIATNEAKLKAVRANAAAAAQAQAQAQAQGQAKPANGHSGDGHEGEAPAVSAAGMSSNSLASQESEGGGGGGGRVTPSIGSAGSSTSVADSGISTGFMAAVAGSGIRTHEAQIERLLEHLDSDRVELSVQAQRRVLMQHTLWMEMTYFHKSHAMIAPMWQAFAQDHIKTSQSLVDNWKALSPVVHDLPMEVNGFN